MVNESISQYVIVASELSEGQSLLLWWRIWRRRIFSRASHCGIRVYERKSSDCVLFLFEGKIGAYEEVKVGIGYDLVGGSDFKTFSRDERLNDRKWAGIRRRRRK